MNLEFLFECNTNFELCLFSKNAKITHNLFIKCFLNKIALKIIHIYAEYMHFLNRNQKSIN